MSRRKLDIEVYTRAGFSREHAGQLADILGVIREADNRRIQNGEPSLLDLVREKRSKQIEQLQSQNPDHKLVRQATTGNFPVIQTQANARE